MFGIRGRGRPAPFVAEEYVCFISSAARPSRARRALGSHGILSGDYRGAYSEEGEVLRRNTASGAVTLVR